MDENLSIFKKGLFLVGIPLLAQLLFLAMLLKIRSDEDEAQHWAMHTKDVMVRAVHNSLCFGLYAPDGRLVGFARAVTDLATFAWLCDVYIEPPSRGRGLGTWLASSATGHLMGHGLRRVVLATMDAHGVYEKAGYAPLSRPERWLEIFREVAHT